MVAKCKKTKEHLTINKFRKLIKLYLTTDSEN